MSERKMDHLTKKHCSIFLLIFIVFFISCNNNNNNTAQIWTDRPEFGFYSEYFNTSQNKYKVSVKYYDYPAAELEKTDRKKDNYYPDIIIGSWLRNYSTRASFKPLDKLFGADKLSRSVFYSRMLAVGRIENNQYLLPVSFNTPALIFSTDSEIELSDQFTIGLDEIKKLSGNYNAISRNAYTRMGFSPFWNDKFLLITAIMFDVSFRENEINQTKTIANNNKKQELELSSNPLLWDENALNKTTEYIYNWTNEINTSSQAEEDFTFKYFYEPPGKLVQSGRILFSYMDSNELFVINEDRKNNIDFRWLMENNKIPVMSEAVYLGIPKKGKSNKAVEAFIYWFFTAENQKLLMEHSKSKKIDETVFGICGGFSALNTVTEQIFPQFYPELLGRMPPSEFLIPYNNMPSNWHAIKQKVVIPYMNDCARNGNETTSLDKQLSDWIRINH